MKWVCTESVTLGAHAFSALAELVRVPEAEITPDTVRDADAVITRSKTRLDRALLQGSSVRFAGTCTAGTDHADIPALRELGIHFASAPGCNANAVSEYVLAALLERGFRFRDKVVGIIGHGQVGTRVDRKLAALGCHVLRHDPPKEARGEPGPYTGLDELLERSDVVTLHVPLVEDGPHPTRNLLGEDNIARMKPGALLVNASRGEALHQAAAARARREGALSSLILDVWNPEPDLPPDILDAADLATPHIAGHSVEGKVNGTHWIRDQLVDFFQLDVADWDPTPLLPAPEHADITLPPHATSWERLRAAVRACYDIRIDDAHLRQPVQDRARHFTTLRRSYRDRREFSATTLNGLTRDEAPLYRALGFHVHTF